MKFIESIQALDTCANIHVIIIDNNSCDAERLALNSAQSNNIVIINHTENCGYFKALNLGIKYVFDKYVSLNNLSDVSIIVGNNDLEFDRQFIYILDSVEPSNDTMVIAPNVITRDGYNQNPHCVSPVSFFRKCGYRLYFTNYYFGQLIYRLTQIYKGIKGPRKNQHASTTQFIYMGIGACYILTENFFKKFSRLDDRVFLWGEEALLAGQVASVGGRILYEPNLVVYHNENTSVSKIPSKQAYNILKKSYKIYSRYL